MFFEFFIQGHRKRYRDDWQDARPIVLIHSFIRGAMGIMISKYGNHVLRGWVLLLGMLTSVQAACPGDTDWNGAIDISDLVRFMHYYQAQDPVVRRLADTNQDGKTNVADVATIFQDYRDGCPVTRRPCPGDTDWDGALDVGDLSRFFHYYQSADYMVRRVADVNQDGATNVADIATMFDIYYGN